MDTNKKDKNKKEDLTDSNDLVSPENTEKLYGEVDEPEVRPGDNSVPEINLPDEVDDVEENMFPSAD